MALVRLSRDNGLWNKLWIEWDAACENYGENFGEFAPSALSVLKPLAEDPQTRHAGVFGWTGADERIHAACQLNVAALPGYTGKVLRLRHLVLSPDFDFSETTTVDQYVDVLGGVFAGTMELASSELPADHVKLHFRSPADREFFNRFREYLQDTRTFKTVQMRGAWLYLSKM